MAQPRPWTVNPNWSRCTYDIEFHEIQLLNTKGAPTPSPTLNASAAIDSSEGAPTPQRGIPKYLYSILRVYNPQPLYWNTLWSFIPQSTSTPDSSSRGLSCPVFPISKLSIALIFGQSHWSSVNRPHFYDFSQFLLSIDKRKSQPKEAEARNTLNSRVGIDWAIDTEIVSRYPKSLIEKLYITIKS